MKCAKCGNPDIYKSWKSLLSKGTTAMCRMCFGNAMRDAKILNKELCERCE
jgi:hypothetical protein